MISAKSFQMLCQPSRLLKFSAINKLHSLKTKQKKSSDIADDKPLSREQVLEIYDWIAQLNAQERKIAEV